VRLFRIGDMVKPARTSRKKNPPKPSRSKRK
jgi:hypothetical protein